MKYFIYAIVAAVAASVVAGFFIVGSPQEERLRRFDEQRVGDLQFLQSEIVNYWQAKNALPGSLAEIRDDIRGIGVPKDPQSGSEYTYAAKGPEIFELCAVFARPVRSKSPEATADAQAHRTSNGARPSVGSLERNILKPAIPRGEPFLGSQNWEHGDGKVCFERTIDKDFYKSKEPMR